MRVLILAFWISDYEEAKMNNKAQTEITEHNGKKVTKNIPRQNGQISYSIKGVYIGTDVRTW